MIILLTKKGDEHAEARLRAMGDRARDARPLWNEVAPVVMDAQQRKFTRGWTKSEVVGTRLTLRNFQGGARGEIRETRRRQRTRYTLVLSGRLKRSLIRFRAPGMILDAQEHELRYGTGVFYARFLRKQGFKIIQIDKRGREQIAEKVADFLAAPARLDG